MEIREITEDRFIECMTIDFPNFKISKSNLTHPTSEFVISFYLLILHNAIEVQDPDEVWNVTEDQRSYINSYHAEAVSFSQHVWVHNLHSVIKYVFNRLSENGSEFVYSDILFPENTPRRSFVFMAFMMNFYWYSIDFTNELDSDIAACIEKVQNLKQMKDEREKLISQLRELEFQRCQYAELYKDKKRLIKKNSEANEEKEIIMKDLLGDEENIQKEFDRVEADREKLQAALIKLQNEKHYHESLVVSNEHQVRDIYRKHIAQKDECLKKLTFFKEQVKHLSNTLVRSNKVLELQQKINQEIKNEKQPLNSSQKKQKGFQDLHRDIFNLTEEMKKMSEEEASLDKKLQIEEALIKLKNENKKLEMKGNEILICGKENVKESKTRLEELKKNHSQLLAKIKKDFGHSEEIIAVTADLQGKCSNLEKQVNSIDAMHKDRYTNYMNDMKAVFDLLEDSFGMQKKDITL